MTQQALAVRSSRFFARCTEQRHDSQEKESSNFFLKDSADMVIVTGTVQVDVPLFTFTFTYPLTARVVGAPQMISQPVSSIFPCSPKPFGTWRTPGLSISRCCFPTSSSACHVFSTLSLCLARWFWLDLMNGRHVHTISVCVSLRWPGGLPVVQLPSGSWHGLPRW